ncbi:MAG: DUF5050 domain-containing protein [Eubacteriales bacterium]
MKKIGMLLAAVLLLCGCNTDPSESTSHNTSGVYTPDVSGKLSDEPLTLNRSMPLSYANGNIYAAIGFSNNAYLVRYNCTSGRTSNVCADPLCFHENEECPMVGIQQWNILPDGKVCYSQKYDHIYRDDAGVITKEVHIFDHALYDPMTGKKTVLYEYDGSYFSGPELFSQDYRFYHSIEYDEARKLFVTGLYRMNLKNGDIKLLIEHGTSDKNGNFNVSSEMFGIDNERIYLSDGRTVFSIDFEGENRVTYLEGQFTMALHSDGEFIYYQKDDGIYRRSLSGSEEEHIVTCENIYGHLTLTTNWIYYQAGNTVTIGKLDLDGYEEKEAKLSGGEIWRCRHDGSELTKIATIDGEYAHIRPGGLTVAGDYIYSTYTGWQDKNGDGIFDAQLFSRGNRDSLPILRIDAVSGEITMITLK